MEPNRKGRVLISLVAAAALAPAGGCKKDGDAEKAGAPVGEKVEGVQPDQVAPTPGDPHGGAMASPHGGATGNPHGDMAMRGGGGGVLEKTAEGRAVLGPVTFAPPQGWQEKPTTSSMRAGQFAIPGEAGEAELVIYFFGSGGAGSVEDNLARWHDQFQADGGGKVTPKTSKKEVAGMQVTMTAVEGRYVAAMRPGAPEKHDKPDHAMLGAIVETSGGPYYFKLVGPAKTVSAARADFVALIDSIQPAAAK
ncbi:MAG TPA: hypothetical protein VKZ63_16555 [Kofleriaceae bacterium]|nr:hypothetical protein [Kofleriaceae bacterium]